MKGYCNSSPPSGERFLLLASTNQNKFFEIRTSLGQDWNSFIFIKLFSSDP